jgi:hypothetical protein
MKINKLDMFMKKLNYYQPHKTIDYDAEAVKFKKCYGFTLPPKYLDFLKVNGTGIGPIPGEFGGSCLIEEFYPFSAVGEEDEYTSHYAYEDFLAMERISKNLLPVASAQGGHAIFCLVLEGALYGKVLKLGDESIILSDGYSVNDIDVASGIIYGEDFEHFVDQLGSV